MTAERARTMPMSLPQGVAESAGDSVVCGSVLGVVTRFSCRTGNGTTCSGSLERSTVFRFLRCKRYAVTTPEEGRQMRADVRQNRAALVDAAWRLVAEKGPGVSMRSVAAEAGVGIATFYRHFPTRDDLITGVVTEMVDRVLAVIGAHADEWGTVQGAEQAWHAVSHGIADLGLGDVALGTIAVVPVDGKVWRETAGLRSRLDAAYRQLLQTAASYGLVSEELTVWRYHLGLGALSRPLAARAEKFAPGQSDWLVEVFLRGLRP